MGEQSTKVQFELLPVYHCAVYYHRNTSTSLYWDARRDRRIIIPIRNAYHDMSTTMFRVGRNRLSVHIVQTTRTQSKAKSHVTMRIVSTYHKLPINRQVIDDSGRTSFVLACMHTCVLKTKWIQIPLWQRSIFPTRI